MNFCIEGIGTNISVNQAVLDGHEVENLLKRNEPSRVSLFETTKKGFMADHFVRPPITITINFPISIEISHIVISPKLNNQTSSAFSIETETSIYRKKYGGGGEKLNQIHQIGKEYFNNTIPDVFVFRNPRFAGVRPPFYTIPEFVNSKNHPCTFDLKHPTNYSCEKVVSLQISILRVSHMSVPSIGYLQVWAQPSSTRSSSAIDVDKIFKLWSVYRKTLKPEDNSFQLKRKLCELEEEGSASCKILKKSSEDETTKLKIPDEFFDSLTFDLMVQPIRLPCGQAIDAKTLEKYISEEAVWGRPPSDPFTGQRFNDKLQPISDVTLKTRIDTFISKHSEDWEELHKIPRTLGSAPKQKSFPFQRPPKMSKPPSASLGSQDSSNNSIQYLPKETIETIGIGTIGNEDKLKSELNRILSNGSLYLKTSTISSAQENADKGLSQNCIHCKTNPKDNPSLLMYSGNCNHFLICRNCLKNIDKKFKNACKVCESLWTVQECQRYFII